MKKTLLSAVTAAALFFVLSVLAPQAEAQIPGCWPWFSPYPADFTTLYRSGRIPDPPYFALHPPVYYSLPVARPYGYSPYAYPPFVQTPEPVIEEPKTVPNPYVPSSATTAPADRVTAARPKLIVNPYVVRTASSGSAAQSWTSAKVVYPAAAFAEK